ncbi:L,D-transpeptidase family protein [Paludifilum halophilum]|nr:L,D-transpeptidase family protein [Paludifilum halophilum]
MKQGKWLFAPILALAFLFTVSVPDAEAASAFHIDIDLAINRLILFKNGTVQNVYPVATGRTPSLTPEGTFTIITKFIKPGWKGIPGGVPENPLGERWLGLKVNGDQGRTYGIHGTNNPQSIGSHASSGCVRMYNEDVIQLYDTVPIGTPVTIHTGKTGDREQIELQPASGQVKITVPVANIRSHPSLDASILHKSTRGTPFTLTGSAGDWYRVQTDADKTAYVHRTVAEKIPSTLRVTAPLANIRQTPSMTGEVVQRVPEGTRLHPTEMKGNWHRIRLNNGKTAYIHKNVVR